MACAAPAVMGRRAKISRYDDNCAARSIDPDGARSCRERVTRVLAFPDTDGC